MTSIIDTIEGIVAFAALALLIYGPWQWACTDAARQVIFEKRDRLFDLAREGRIEFSSTEYQTLREAFNRQVRFAHVLNWVRLAVFARSIRNDHDASTAIAGALSRIENLETRQEASRLISDANDALIRMIILKSPMLLLVAALRMLLRKKENGLKLSDKLGPYFHDGAAIYTF